MIAFNGQYLPAASHGNMRITAACLGGQWVIGGKWLTHATQQAIIAGFGAEEGIAVIIRTNDYLNALAATDTQRAQQLAMFIQEDPLLVTSLVETSKVRILDTNGAINTPLGVTTSSKTALKVTLEFTAYTGNVHIGYHPGNDSKDWRLFCTGGTMYFDCGSARISQGFALNRKAEIECGVTYITVDGITKTAATSGTIAEGEIALCKADGAFKSYGNFEIFDGEQWNVFAPMIDKDGVGCVLNLTKCTTHYPSSGAFTIAITDKQ